MGPLSTAAGAVAITWEVVDPRSDARLSLRWTERGGPPVRPPTRRGFGSRLIERSLAAENGGSATIEYPPEGVVCIMEAPIRGRVSQLQVSGREARDDAGDLYGTGQ